MPNWCSSSYVLVGSADEVKKLYGIMKKLERRKKGKHSIFRLDTHVP